MEILMGSHDYQLLYIYRYRTLDHIVLGLFKKFLYFLFSNILDKRHNQAEFNVAEYYKC